MLRLYYFNAEALNDDTLFEKYFERMSENRQKKVNSFRFRRDKNLSLGAGILTDFGLREYGLSERSMKYTFRANGKPCFENEPLIHFNLSHSESAVIAAFSDHEVGCDVEMVTEIDLSIAKRFFFGSEYENIASQPTKNAQTDLFFRYWTLKESFMKMVGLGMKLPLDSFEMRLSEYGITVVQEVDDREYHFAELDTIPGYKCAVCTFEECVDTKVEQVQVV